MNSKAPARPQYGTFESIRQSDAAGNEFWLARDLQLPLDYGTWQAFRKVVEKAMEACRQSGRAIDDHFSQMTKMVGLGSGARRDIEDFRLSRYACYLIVQNGDSSKPVIANGKTYFAVQTRRQELHDRAAFSELEEDEKRLAARYELARHNKHPPNRAGSQAPRQKGVARPDDPESLAQLLTRDGGLIVESGNAGIVIRALTSPVPPAPGPGTAPSRRAAGLQGVAPVPPAP